MSAKIEVPAGRGYLPGAIAVMMVAVLAVGAFAVTVATRAVQDRPAASTSSAPLWDAQKLEAMQGRMLADTVGRAPATWDAQKIEAMSGRVLADEFRAQPATWDAQKLEAMAGRVLAEQFRAQDPRDGIGGVSPSGYRTGGPT